MPDVKPLILFIDAYDSFSNNIISLLETELACSVRGVKIDNPVLLASEEALLEELSHYAAVVCGPGPGHPENEKDVGIISRIWRLGDEQILPVLGICLGFQSLCLEFGGEVKRMRGPQHGMIRRVTHIGESAVGKESIFRGIDEVKATLYQSLCADIGPDMALRSAAEIGGWNPTSSCPDLLPLAWVDSEGAEHNSGVMDDRVLVAVRHRTKPFWALQYHPESICTGDESKQVIRNWFADAMAWNRKFRQGLIASDVPYHGGLAFRESLRSKSEVSSSADITAVLASLGISLDSGYRSKTITLPEYVSVPDIMEAIHDLRQDQIMFESSNTRENSAGSIDVRGKHSIIGLEIENSLKLEYTTGNNFITAVQPSSNGDVEIQIDLLPYGGVWPFLSQFMHQQRNETGLRNSPFWGGLMGYVTYEMGLVGIDVKSKSRKHRQTSRPDLCFAWVTRSLVIDHEKSLVYLQELTSISPQTLDWMDTTAQKIEALSLPIPGFLHPHISSSHPLMRSANSSQSSLNLNSSGKGSARPQSSNTSIHTDDSPKPPSDSLKSITTPSSTAYESKVHLCQSHIRTGDSYELCLTDQTVVRRQRFDLPSNLPNQIADKAHNGPDAWHLYRTLRARQPAPFASYLRLGPCTLISSSPERFLTYTHSTCSLRPMKGTVRKSPAVPTLADAIPLLDIPKEKAENLMIVDLVRHDLYGVCGSGKVSVPRLMVVEEYRSVFQMISVVEGQIPDVGGYTGLDVLAASLPPGSMTGAPKKRSCEILQDVEGQERSLYSGVVGYMDVGGRGDWSVNIRCMYRWDDEDEVVDANEGKRVETWHIGAGGAVTTLSTPEGEREEMLTKLNGTLGVFR
jgi:para-aminobenzoate synthetase